jgi:MFS family permease
LTPELARLIAAQICLHACMAGMRMAAPLLALRQGQGALAAGVLLAFFGLTQVFLALPAGRYADRHGVRKPVGWAVLCSVLGVSLAAIWPIFPCLCVAALAAGGATGVTVIALQRQVGRAAPDHLALKQAFSWLSVGPALSNFLGPFSAGLLIDYAGDTAGDLKGFQIAFMCLALLPILTWCLVRTARELPSLAALNTTKAEPGKRSSAWDLLRNKTLSRLLLVNWFLSTSWDVHTFVVPVLGHDRGYSAAVIGGLLGAFAVAATVVRMILPWLAGRVREWAVIFSAMLITCALFCVYPFLPTPFTMGICSVLLGLSLGSVQPMIMSTLHQITPEHRRGEALGLRLMTINASSVVMPMLFGAAGAVVGVGAVFGITAFMLAAGSRLAYGLRKA